MPVNRTRALVLVVLGLVVLLALMPWENESIASGISAFVVAIATVALVFVTLHHADVSRKMVEIAQLSYEPVPSIKLVVVAVPVPAPLVEFVDLEVKYNNLGDHPFYFEDVVLYAYWIDEEGDKVITNVPAEDDVWPSKLPPNNPRIVKFHLVNSDWQADKHPPSDSLEEVRLFAVLYYRGLADKETKKETSELIYIKEFQRPYPPPSVE